MGAPQPSHALLESLSCLSSLVWSSRLVGRCFGGIQAGISDRDGCDGSLQGLVTGF